jgi:hypothetical protein
MLVRRGLCKWMLGPSGGFFDSLHYRQEFLRYRNGLSLIHDRHLLSGEDSTSIAGRLHDRLRAEFGKESVLWILKIFGL